ncbi:MAG TPA: class I SAM-dependent methyltransferase [Vicinamibacteria bacterium]|nr:class I SAM-dependent methyltransferase [Vicinamibacteria bacterium]
MSDRKRWERRHGDFDAPAEPSPFLRKVLPMLRRGRALDVACGSGANARLLAENDFAVDALDWSVAALSKLSHPAVRRLACDVTRFPLPPHRYDAVVCVRFLDRSLWPAMVKALRPGGALVLETFTRRYLERRPDFRGAFCLEEGELVRAFASSLRIALYEELPSSTTACLLGFR